MQVKSIRVFAANYHLDVDDNRHPQETNSFALIDFLFVTLICTVGVFALLSLWYWFSSTVEVVEGLRPWWIATLSWG